MQTITAQVYCIGLTETYCANWESRSSEEPWGSVAQAGSVVSGSFHPPASTFYRFNNLGWICSITGHRLQWSRYHLASSSIQADCNCVLCRKMYEKSRNILDINYYFPCMKIIKEKGLAVMATFHLDLAVEIRRNFSFDTDSWLSSRAEITFPVIELNLIKLSNKPIQ